MLSKVAEVVGGAVERISSGREVRARTIDGAKDALVRDAYAVADDLRSPLRTVAALGSALLAAYHLGRQHALERVAIGIDVGAAEAWRESVGEAKESRDVPGALED